MSWREESEPPSVFILCPLEATKRETVKSRSRIEAKEPLTSSECPHPGQIFDRLQTVYQLGTQDLHPAHSPDGAPEHSGWNVFRGTSQRGRVFLSATCWEHLRDLKCI